MNPELKSLVDQGKRQFEGRNYSRAEQLFQRVLKAGHRYPDVLNALGVIYHLDGKFNNAIEAFEEALAINPNYTEAALNLAVLFNDLGEYKKGKELFARVQKRKTGTGMDAMTRGKIANMHGHVGDLYRATGKIDEAIGEYQKSLKLCPSFVDIRTKLATAHREKNQPKLALKELTDVVAKNPSFREGYIQLGITHYTMGDKKKAASVWNELLKKDKNNEVAKMYLRLCENGKSGAPVP